VQKLDNLTLNSTLADLPSHECKFDLKTVGQVIAKSLQRQPELPGIMITANNNKIVGMISRARFFEWLSRPYGSELFLKRPIQVMLNMIGEELKAIPDVEIRLAKCLVLSASCPIDKAVEIALQRPASVAYEPIVIAGENSQWRLLDMQVLLLAKSQLFALAKESADAANRAKSEFLANMSHELRTPLNAILGFSQVMKRSASLSPEQQQYLGIINSAGEHLLELINDVLEMSKIEACRTTFYETSFDLYRLLDNLHEMLKLKASSKNLQLIFERSSEVPQYLQTDERKLRQVLINLIGNAIKFTDKGSVTLRVMGNRSLHSQAEPGNEGDQKDNYQLFFEVEDTGLGILPAEIEQLFAAFGQTETGRKSGQGTGLGLAISQKYVQMMGGEIKVKSTPGEGSIFSFDILVKRSQIAEVSPPQETRKVIGLAPHQPQYRILVVDDSWESRLLLVRLLTSLGFVVEEAENGLQGFHLWSSFSPHLIFMDMHMPVMNGYESTKQIKAHFKGKETTIIALTASAFEEERKAILSAGCDEVISKPFRQELLLEKIAESLGVKYLYEESAVQDQDEATKDELNAAERSLNFHLYQMPVEWVEKLNKAALKCRDRDIIQLCEQIPKTHSPLAKTLTNWANDFLFDKVIDLIQAVPAKKPALILKK
jgi:signal transduction histidine kinase/DNA-binding NarL/FixJ family response regulator